MLRGEVAEREGQRVAQAGTVAAATAAEKRRVDDAATAAGDGPYD